LVGWPLANLPVTMNTGRSGIWLHAHGRIAEDVGRIAENVSQVAENVSQVFSGAPTGR
jgi:hypothetical protein